MRVEKAEGLLERLERDFFISQVMVGDCPRCGSQNTHDCEAPNLASGPPGPHEGFIETGSGCGAARELDNVTIGHCDSCDYLWCLECGSTLALDEKACGHWAVCGECREEKGFFTLDEMMEKVCASCENWDNGCRLDEPSECERAEQYRCPHQVDMSECPTLTRWKRETGTRIV